MPADAKGGKYKSVFRTVWPRSNEQGAPVDLVVNVEVDETFTCKQAPVFTDISSAEEAINDRNSKEVAINLSGTVSASDGSDIVNPWYQLTDEYGEQDHTEALVINDDGTFSVAIPMVASGKKKDEDGRLYTVIFFAENEAGVNESPETTIVVLHNNHKKVKHKKGKHKKENYCSKKESHYSKKRDS